MRPSDLRTAVRFYVRQWIGAKNKRRVLDVGSGHRPHEDATHLVELLVENDTQRGKKMKVLGRTLIQADVEAIPFKDKSFDYVYACHVLEHTKDPETACNELMRVAKAGYIETPSPFYEQGYNYPHPERGWPFHRWFVWLGNNQTLIFEPKTPESIDYFCDCWHSQFIKKIFSAVGDINQIHKLLPHECNYTVLHWSGRFNFEVRKGG